MRQLLRKKCPNTEFFLVCIFLYSVRIQKNTNQKKLRIWTLFTHLTPTIWYHPNTIIYISKKHTKYCPIWEFGRHLGTYKALKAPGLPKDLDTWVLKALGHSKTWGNQEFEGTLFSKLLKAISSCHTTLISKSISPIRKHCLHSFMRH